MCLLISNTYLLFFVTWKSWFEKFFLVHFIHRNMFYNQKRNWDFYFGHIFFDKDISSAEKNLYIWQMLCNFTRKHNKSSFFYENRTAHNVVSILISWSYWLLGKFFLQKNSLLNFLKEGLFEVLYKSCFCKKKVARTELWEASARSIDSIYFLHRLLVFSIERKLTNIGQ